MSFFVGVALFLLGRLELTEAETVVGHDTRHVCSPLSILRCLFFLHTTMFKFEGPPGLMMALTGHARHGTCHGLYQLRVSLVGKAAMAILKNSFPFFFKQGVAPSSRESAWTQHDGRRRQLEAGEDHMDIDSSVSTGPGTHPSLL